MALVQRLERKARQFLGAGGRIFGAPDDRRTKQCDHRMGSRDWLARHGQGGGVRRLETHNCADIGTGSHNIEMNAPFACRLPRTLPGAIFAD